MKFQNLTASLAVSFCLVLPFVLSNANPVSAQASTGAGWENAKSPASTQASTPASQAQMQKGAATVVTTADGLQPEPGLYTKQCVCQGQFPPFKAPGKKKKHPILKGLGKEIATEMGDLGKDMFMAFSVQGNDPYEMPDNPNIPYVEAEAQFVDGSYSHVIKYPDGSIRISGGFLDGTYACPQPDGLFIVQYTNGARGTMKMTPAGGEVIRPDNTVTTFTKVGQGSMRITNSKLGYMGDITPDTTGLSYEFAKQNFQDKSMY